MTVETMQKVPTGIAGFDEIGAGGLPRGRTTLLVGGPGSGKTVFTLNLLVNGARQYGEPGIFVAFEENSEQLIANAATFGWDLPELIDQQLVIIDAHLAAGTPKTGLLRLYGNRAEAYGATKRLAQVQALVREHRPACNVIDPLSAMAKTGGPSIAKAMTQRLIYEAKAAGITMLMTSLLSENDPSSEATPLEISTIADAWIHLSYVIVAGERNRALTIIKSRGTAHSNQVRELILSSQGVDLTEVYTAGGEVLMGALRYEKETRERENIRRQAAETAHLSARWNCAGLKPPCEWKRSGARLSRSTATLNNSLPTIPARLKAGRMNAKKSAAGAGMAGRVRNILNEPLF